MSSLSITLAGQQLVLLPGTTLNLELNSALFAEEVFRGTYSYAFTLPLDENRAMFGYPEIIENLASLRRAFSGCDVEWEGHALGRHGELRIQRIKTTQVSVTVVFGLSQIARALSERKLATFSLGGTRSVVPIIYLDTASFGVPGLVQHALATVQEPEAYDYVFAPFINYTYTPEPIAGIPPGAPPVVNSWYWTPTPLFTYPEGGTFTYYIPFTVMGLPPLFGYVDPGLTPLPKLRFVLRSLFAELGVLVGADELVGELANLVMLSGYQASHEFHLAYCMPDITPKDLLLKLRKTIGLIPDVDSAGRVNLFLLQERLNADEFDDWSAIAAEQLDEREVPEAAGRRLTYTVPEDDATKAFYQTPADLPVGATAASLINLPLGGPVAETLEDQIRLVEDEQRYYRSTVQVDYAAGTFTYNWTLSGSNYRPVDVAGGGEEEAQGVTAVATVDGYNALIADSYSHAQEALFPAITRKQFIPGRPDADRGTDLQLVFFRGRQPYRISANHPNAADNPDYPLITPFNRNAKGEEVGALSLQLDGAAGTVQNFLGDWLTLMATAAPVKWRVWLTAEQLANPRLHIRKRIAGNEYFVRKISVSVPMSKPAIVELIPIPPSLGR